jgi:hypothetical protein
MNETLKDSSTTRKLRNVSFWGKLENTWRGKIHRGSRPILRASLEMLGKSVRGNNFGLYKSVDSGISTCLKSLGFKMWRV